VVVRPGAEQEPRGDAKGERADDGNGHDGGWAESSDAIHSPDPSRSLSPAPWHHGGVEHPSAHPDGPTQPGPRASLAAFLSFLFPGLGQAFNGQPSLAWLLAAPMLALVAGIGLVLLGGTSDLMARLFDVRFLVGLVLLDAVVLVWRLVGVVQAFGHRARPALRSGATWATGLLVVATLVMHALPAYYAAKAIDTLGAVSLGGGHGAQLEDVFGALSGAPVPSSQPDVTVGERVNILLVGTDSLPSRTTALTDTMLVVSLDPNGTASAMISIPRDLYGVPLPNGTPYNNKLNSLMPYAANHKKEFPLGGVGTLKATIGKLLGVQIHYFAAVNLLGFKQVVDSIGGVDIVVQRAVNDPTYDNEYDKVTGFYIKVGKHHMDGHTALAFVRSRKGAGDSDFTRADRQQQLLTAIRAKLTAGNLLLALPGLLDAVKNTIATDVPSDRIAELAQAVQQADMSQLQRIVLQPPDYMHADPFSAAGYILVPNLEAIHRIGEQLLSGVAPTPSPTPTPVP
jgi:LCP family protein required for cell wall assembly